MGNEAEFDLLRSLGFMENKSEEVQDSINQFFLNAIFWHKGIRKIWLKVFDGEKYFENDSRTTLTDKAYLDRILKDYPDKVIAFFVALKFSPSSLLDEYETDLVAYFVLDRLEKKVFRASDVMDLQLLATSISAFEDYRRKKFP